MRENLLLKPFENVKKRKQPGVTHFSNYSIYLITKKRGDLAPFLKTVDIV
jgi:hypothetical protein